MVRRPLFFIIVILGGISLAAWLVYRSGNQDERIIRRTLERLRETAEFAGEQNPISAAAASKRFGSYFTKQVDCRGGGLPQPVSRRSELEALMFQVRSQFDRLDIKTRDIEVELGPGPTNATMTLATRVRMRGLGAEEQSWNEVEVSWARTDEGWKVSGARGLDAIRMP